MPDSTVKSFSIVDQPESTTGFEMVSSKSEFKPRVHNGTGKTRQEVLLGLNIKRAELLANGEVKLGNGKIIGARKFKHLYRQKLAPEDNRESVVIGKLRLEYKKVMMLENGGVGDKPGINYMPRQAFSDKVKALKEGQKRGLKSGMTANVFKHFKDPTGFL